MTAEDLHLDCTGMAHADEMSTRLLARASSEGLGRSHPRTARDTLVTEQARLSHPRSQSRTPFIPASCSLPRSAPPLVDLGRGRASFIHRRVKLVERSGSTTAQLSRRGEAPPRHDHEEHRDPRTGGRPAAAAADGPARAALPARRDDAIITGAEPEAPWHGRGCAPARWSPPGPVEEALLLLWWAIAATSRPP